VSLTCQAGTITGLFGPNGAGKSTLLSVLSTLARPSEGVVRYGNATAEECGDALRERIGVLGHDLFLYADLSARENLAFFARLYGVADVDRAIDRGLAAARLTDRAHDRAGSFSRGLRQRLALERALVHQPRLVLLDEPFTGLDDASTGALVSRLKMLRDTGAIVILATHDLDLAEGLLDHALFLRDGRIVEAMTAPNALRSTYRSVIGR